MAKHHNLVYETIDYDQEEEEDAFYTELRRQILVLMEEGEDDDFLASKTSRRQTSFKRSMNFDKQVLGIYSNYWNSSGNSVPTWLVDLWRNGPGGTGVFIPHIVKSRRRNKSGKRNSGKWKTYTSNLMTSNVENIIS